VLGVIAPDGSMDVIGVDVGGTTVRAVAFDGDLAVVAGRHAPTPTGASAIAELVGDLVRDLAGAGASAPALVAVGLPGRVDPEAGTVATAVNLGLADAVPMAALIADATGSPVHIENDVNAAALGTFAYLGLDGGASLAYVNVGTGIAAGFVLGGRLWRGATGGAGEIGHVPMRPGGPPCTCGQVGCAEAVGSGRAASGDADRRADVVDTVAWTVQLAVMTLDVDVVAVGGGMTERPGFADALRDELDRRAASSRMLAAAGLAGRVRAAPAGIPVGSVGAVLAARSTAR